MNMRRHSCVLSDSNVGERSEQLVCDVKCAGPISEFCEVLKASHVKSRTSCAPHIDSTEIATESELESTGNG